MKKWRKYFNIPSKKEDQLITQDCDKLVKLASEFSDKEFKDNEERYNRMNSFCPNCKATNIVNKIARVVGSGQVSGNLWGIHGSSHTDTNEVNHCNACGNQWKKLVFEVKWKDDIIADWMNNLNYIEKNPTLSERTIEKLKDFSAESLWSEFVRVQKRCYYSTQETLSLSLLRTKFKSVYDESKL